MNKQEKLLDWYRKNRRELPFRASRNPYSIWISEIMAQQTRIEAMLPYYRRFIERYPDVPSLAAAQDEELMKLWQGLGYYSRARNLKKAALQCMERHNGQLPRTFQDLKALAGIGDYTAGAIASIAYGQRECAIDGNVLRVYSRLIHEEREISSKEAKKAIEQAVRNDLPAEKDMHDWNQALMELGASICLPRNPKCEQCPLLDECQAFQTGDAASLPRKKVRKKREIEEKTFYLCLAWHKGQWYTRLEKQPSTGLLADLYLFCQQPPRQILKQYELRDAKHIFTHREWLMKGFLVLTDYDESMISLQTLEAEKALPSAMRPFYRQMLEFVRKQSEPA